MSDEQPITDDDAGSDEDCGSDPTPEDLRQTQISRRVAEISQRRAVIEQVKGVLALVYDVTPEQAFALLRWRSQATNVKLRAFSEQVFAELRVARSDGDVMPTRAVVDRIFMTAHERIPAPSTDDLGGRTRE